MEKTVKDIQKWFEDSIKEELKNIPDRVKSYAKENQEFEVIAYAISRKLGFNKKEVIKYLKTVL